MAMIGDELSDLPRRQREVMEAGIKLVRRGLDPTLGLIAAELGDDNKGGRQRIASITHALRGRGIWPPPVSEVSMNGHSHPEPDSSRDEVGDDEELAVMTSAVRSLFTLNEKARARVMAYLCDRFGERALSS
jgi:hypothetical protein